MFCISRAHATTTIVVNIGPFESVEAAAQAEERVDWFDADMTDDIACTQCFAAMELQRFLREATGLAGNFAVVKDAGMPEGELILLGGPDSNRLTKRFAQKLGIDAGQLKRLGPQGYRIKTETIDGRRVTVVAGGGRVGTLYGAYDLLHRLGTRWFGPENFHTEVASIKWNPGFDASERPDFLTRGFLAVEDRGSEEFILWMARNRLNEWTVAYRNQSLLRKLGIRMVCGNHDAEWNFFAPIKPYPYNHPKFKGDDNNPEDPYPVSVLYKGDTDGNGKLSYFEAHPEWYPVVNGKRVPGVGDWGGTNFCTSNADACSEFVKNYVDGIIDGPYRGADLVRFWTLDGGKWCQCENCKSLGIPSDHNLRLVYRLDKELKKAHREGRLNRVIPIRFLVYADVLAPPTRPLPDDFDYDTCTATFYPISRCYVHNFDHASCPRNVNYRKKLHGWAVDPGRRYRGQLVIGEYYNVSRYKSLPICFMHTMANDIPHYYKTGARFFQYMHVTTGRWGNKSLTNYQMARQLWDVETDCRGLWQDFFERRYGPAAETMREFYESLEKTFSNVEPLKGWSNNLATRLQAGSNNLFNEPHLQYKRDSGTKSDAPTLTEMVEYGRRCRELIDKAMKMDLSKRIKMRLAEDNRQFTYGQRTLAYYDHCCQAFMLGRAGRKDEARVHLVQAKRVADLLRQDTWSMDLAFIHDEPFPLDGFHSTYATGAIGQLEKLLGSDKPSLNTKPPKK
ncbi:MAG: S-layer protein [Pirellulales bacterium]|nr:S-layer protein [Pirellulales bacterium]